MEVKRDVTLTSLEGAGVTACKFSSVELGGRATFTYRGVNEFRLLHTT
jgi:hypothetical protein